MIPIKIRGDYNLDKLQWTEPSSKVSTTKVTSEQLQAQDGGLHLKQTNFYFAQSATGLKRMP